MVDAARGVGHGGQSRLARRAMLEFVVGLGQNEDFPAMAGLLKVDVRCCSQGVVVLTWNTGSTGLWLVLAHLEHWSRTNGSL